MSWLSLFLFLIMLAIIFFQTIHGTFSAMIMAVLTVLCATFAISVHEAVAEDMLIDIAGDYSYALALGGVFAVTLFALRLAADKLIPRSTLLPTYVDKVGSLGFGIITGFVATGILGLSIQMIPWGSTILGFERFDKNGKPHHNLWLNPDKFTVNLCGYLADRTLTGSTSWFEAHPDFVSELYWYRASDAVGSRTSVPRDSVRVVALGKAPELYDYHPAKRSMTGSETAERFSKVDGPPPDKIWLVVSVKADEGARDPDLFYRTSATQVRLVGSTVDGKHTEEFTLKGVGLGGRYVTFAHMPLFGNKTGTFDFVFEVPKDFHPRFVEFKRSGWAGIPGQMISQKLEERESTAPPPTSEAPASRGSSSRRDNQATVPARPKKVGSHFGTKLPLTVKTYSGSASLSGSALRSGQFTLDVDEQLGDTGRGSRSRDRDAPPVETATIETFFVPGDLPLLQLDMEAIIAETTLAGAMNAARRGLKQYHIVDSNGERYWPAGLIAECDVGNKRIMEIQYYPEDVLEFDRSQIRDFRRFKWQDLKGDYRLVFLFVVRPGAKIVEFNSGNKPVSLQDLNLVAPG